MKHIATGVGLVLAFCLASVPTAAQVTAAATAQFPAFSANGSMAVKGSSSGKSGTMNIGMRVMHRERRWRADVLQISATVDDPMMNAFAQMLPKTTVTVVVDQAARMWMIWTPERPLYYQGKLAMPQAKTSPSPHATPSSAMWDNIAKHFKAMTQYDVLNESFTLTGHQAVNGHMSSVFHFTSQMKQHDKPMQNTTGDVALADDLSGIPIHLSVATTGGSTSGNVLMDLTNVTMTAPAAAMFAPPAGYKRSSELGTVLAPIMPVAPKPAATPHG